MRCGLLDPCLNEWEETKAMFRWMGPKDFEMPCGCCRRFGLVQWCDGHLLDPDYPAWHPSVTEARSMSRRLGRRFLSGYVHAFFVVALLGVWVYSWAGRPLPVSAVVGVVLLGFMAAHVCGLWWGRRCRTAAVWTWGSAEGDMRWMVNLLDQFPRQFGRDD